MTSFIRNLSAPAEFCLVILVCFWWGITGSVRQFYSHLVHVSRPEHITNGVVVFVIIMQLLAMAFALWIGKIRGWSLASLGARASWKETGAGALLFIITTSAILCSVVLTNIILPDVRGPEHIVSGVIVSGLTPPFLLLFSLINPVYEEFLGTAYLIYSMRRYGMFPAVLASAFFRSFLHSYQGVDAIVIVLPMGFVFGLYYWRRQQLWPLIVAHVLFDLWPLIRFTHA